MLRGPPDTGLSHPFTHDVYSLLATSNSQASQAPSSMIIAFGASAAGNKKRIVKMYEKMDRRFAAGNKKRIVKKSRRCISSRVKIIVINMIMVTWAD